MNPIDISQKILRRKNYFPRILCFSPAMSHIHKSTKMRFPGNRPKMPQLLKNIISSKMVVRGWYITHFDRRDLLDSEKNVWGGFPNFPDHSGPICDFSRFFREFRGGPRILEKPSSWTYESEKMIKNRFFFNFINFPKNMILELHFGIFTSGILPTDQKCQIFEILTIIFPKQLVQPYFENLSIANARE